MKDEIANKRSTKSRKIGRAISSALELPEDVILGLPRVTLQGDESLFPVIIMGFKLVFTTTLSLLYSNIPQ